MPLEGEDNGKSLSSGDPAQATDGKGGGCVKPPEKETHPFAPLAQTDYLCLIAKQGPPFCLPPGSYRPQKDWGFDIGQVDALTLPGGPGPGQWSLKVHYNSRPYRGHKDDYHDAEYKVNQDPKNQVAEWRSFQADMANLGFDEGGEASFTVVGPDDGPNPVCCLFSETNFGGNVWCVGEGGGDTLPQWKDKAKSVSCHKDGVARLFPVEYGDCASATIDNNVEDLTNQRYGENENFSEKTKAVWVTTKTPE